MAVSYLPGEAGNHHGLVFSLRLTPDQVTAAVVGLAALPTMPDWLKTLWPLILQLIRLLFGAAPQPFVLRAAVEKLTAQLATLAEDGLTGTGGPASKAN